MPDKRKHRGPHPDDRCLFAEKKIAALREATGDLSWLLTRGYSETSAVALVGDRFQLTSRQRNAVRRCACSDYLCAQRRVTCVTLESLADARVEIDGYNLLTTIESALAGAVVLIGRDGAVRDIAGVRGTYRTVEETAPALALIAQVLRNKASEVVWYLDSPVSNSKKLAALLRRYGEEHKLPWDVAVIQNPDAVLRSSENVVVSADSQILDHCRRWLNLAEHIIVHSIPGAFLEHL